jgi:crotonobetainyl-CoA:carnitine CoA-transferase CaiB-like acyl-CoA transferase
MSGALDDITVLDLTRGFPAALSAAFLADFGGRVIRLERLPAAAEPNGAAGHGWNHEADLIHRNKESIALNPQTAEGRKILAGLAGRVDVILTDWLLPELAALGLDYATISAANPRIVYGRLSGFGPQGPDSALPAIDELAAARTGMMPILQQPGMPPVYTGAGQMHAMVMLGFGIVTALIHRQATGEGQEVDTSLFAANMYGASLDIQAYLAIKPDDPQRHRMLNPISRLDVSNPISGALYPSSDGRWVTLTMPDTDRWWPLLAPAVGIDVNDERFNSHDKRCEQNRLLLITELEAGFKKMPGAHWRKVFAEQQMSADVIEQFDYPANDPQVAANRYIIELNHPSHGKVKSLGFPIFMSESPARLESLAPCVGQHTGKVLHELLGYSEDAIFQLTKCGAVA